MVVKYLTLDCEVMLKSFNFPHPRSYSALDGLAGASMATHKPQSVAQRRVGGSQTYYTPVQRTPQHQLHQAASVATSTVPQPQPQPQNPAVALLYAGSQPPTPSPRHKLSSSSCNNADGFEEFRVGGGIGPPPLYAPADYLRNGPSYSNDGGAYRNGYFGKCPPATDVHIAQIT